MAQNCIQMDGEIVLLTHSRVGRVGGEGKIEESVLGAINQLNSLPLYQSAEEFPFIESALPTSYLGGRLFWLFSLTIQALKWII